MGRLNNTQEIPVFGVTGASGSGKTPVLQQIVRVLTSRGWRVAVIKHCPHGFQWDNADRDSGKLSAAGAETVALAADASWAIISRTQEPIASQEQVASPGQTAEEQVAEETVTATASGEGIVTAVCAARQAMGQDPPDLFLVEGFHRWDIPSVHVLGPRDRPPGSGCVALVRGPLLSSSSFAPSAAPTSGSRLPIYAWDDPALADLVEDILQLRGE